MVQDRPRPQWNVERIARDMALRGWSSKDLAKAADISVMRVSRFLNGRHQTSKTAKQIALALGYTTRRYLIVRKDAVPA